MIAIIDYDAGNIKSVEKAIHFLGEEVVLTRNIKILKSADKVILPGVGAFGDAMKALEKYGLIDIIHEIVNAKIPFLGICLGMQLLFEYSEESPGVKGLGILKGEVVRIPNTNHLKVPHIGWNSLTLEHENKLFQHIQEEPFVYFVHSYYIKAKKREQVVATCEYGVEIHAAVEVNNILGCQFHPEKSSSVGLKILKNFIELSKEDF